MQSISFTLLHCRAFLLPLFLCLPTTMASIASVEQLYQELTDLRQTIATTFEGKIAQKQKELERCVATVKKEAIYSELQTALHTLYKEPTYDFYRLLSSSHNFIKQLELYNGTIMRPELLTQINDLLEQLKTHELFTSLRSTLKKQRVALLDLFEEKDLIVSVEKILKYQDKDLTALLAKQKDAIRLLPSFQHACELQKKYLSTASVQKLLNCIEKIQAILLQEQAAFLKNRTYQKALNTHALLTFRPGSAHKEVLMAERSIKAELIQIQYDLYIAPLEDTL